MCYTPDAFIILNVGLMFHKPDTSFVKSHFLLSSHVGFWFQFPLCDGTHNKHNEATGDNVGPLVLRRKEKDWAWRWSSGHCGQPPGHLRVSCLSVNLCATFGDWTVGTINIVAMVAWWDVAINSMKNCCSLIEYWNKTMHINRIKLDWTWTVWYCFR